MSDELISTTRFMLYSDYFGDIARSGLDSARAVNEAISSVTSVDPQTFEVFTDVTNAIDSLRSNIQSSYEQIFTNQFATDPMRESFIQLSEHIMKFTGLTVNEYLSQNSLMVDPTYASLSALFGQVIDSANIR